MIVLVASRVRVVGDVENLLATHRRVTGVRRDPADLPPDWEVVHASNTDRQTTMLVRTKTPINDTAWAVTEVGMEDIVLDYMSQATTGYKPALEVSS
jgi:ABC-2 type transport system ATP-binding protein